MSPLFRPEALAARQTQRLGSVRLTQPIGYGLTAGVGLTVAVGTELPVTFGSYTRCAAASVRSVPESVAMAVQAATYMPDRAIRPQAAAACAVARDWLHSY